MGSEPQVQLHVAFFPFLAHGHMIPTFDIARLFASHGVRATVITTPRNAPSFTKGRPEPGPPIDIEVFEFPSREAGLPEGVENLDQAMGPGMFDAFFRATESLREQLEGYLERARPDCLVADMFFPWATESATRFGIPRLVFHGISNFALCVKHIVTNSEPYKGVSSDEEETFVVPRVPHEIRLTRLMMPPDLLRDDEETEVKKRAKRVIESEGTSFGVIVNSFYELEPDYSDLYRDKLGRRAWNIGPLSICGRRGGDDGSAGEHECLRWLDGRNPSSVVYVCFGSTARFEAPQLHEIAVALEASGQEFVWVVKRGSDDEEEWLPRGFEDRVKGRGLIVRGWAPQVRILEHEAVGGFVTHCGWNSTLEGICAGVPMVTWPIFAEQFYNERFVNVVLKTGVAVGARRWSSAPSAEDLVGRDAVERAVREVMVGEGAEGRRGRAMKLKEMAWRAVQKDGSSYNDLSGLLDELRNYHCR